MLFFIKALVALLTVVDPVGLVLVVLALTVGRWHIPPPRAPASIGYSSVQCAS